MMSIGDRVTVSVRQGKPSRVVGVVRAVVVYTTDKNTVVVKLLSNVSEGWKMGDTYRPPLGDIW
jgi:hypothetical protein